MKNRPDQTANLSAKLIACVFVIAFVIVGAIGLIVPIIPGLLFLAIAIVIVAKTFPSMERRLRRNRTMRRHLDGADGFLGLDPWEKVQYGGWLCLKICLDTIALVSNAITRLLTSTSDGPRRFR